MATIRILLGIVCLVFTHCSGLLSRGNLVKCDQNCQLVSFRRIAGNGLDISKSAENRQMQSERLLSIARLEIGVREATGQNDGKQVETYLHYTGNRKGDPWCASFVSWVFGQVGYAQPKTAWSPALFPIAKQVTQPVPGAIFGIYFAALGRIAHCGFVESQNESWLNTIEGNTNLNGSRNGDGVYRKLRHVKTIKSYSTWLPVQKGGGSQWEKD